ncbi:ABC transporter permease subunit [Nonomuraea sp. NPDC049709]|uniref:carbohydrate ABC transporter permease n=1 Tax=Nonomuraea sp. NPDC049709 TaxID=3154736 RepID=UPI003448CEFB
MTSTLRRGAAGGTRPRDAARHSRSRRDWRQGLAPWLFLLVPLALLVTFSYVPIINMVVYSFTDWDGVSPDYTFTGLENYAEIFTRPELFKVFVASAYYLGAAVLVNFSLAGVSVWRFFGLNFVLFLGAIQSIPPELYEAAELDGAGRWQ